MFCLSDRRRFPLPFERVNFSFLVVSIRLWRPSTPSAFRATRIAAMMRMRRPLSVAALVFFSMASAESLRSGPLPALERTEGYEEANDGDREEVDDRAG